MNHAIHPDYFNCTVTCSCGNTFETRATQKALRIDICGTCHPFYTGKQKFVDTAGRIQRFQEKYKWAAETAKKKSKEKVKHKPVAAHGADQDDE